MQFNAMPRAVEHMTLCGQYRIDQAQIGAGSVSRKRQNETKSTAPKQKRSRKVCAKYNEEYDSSYREHQKMCSVKYACNFCPQLFAHKPNCTRHMEK